MLTNISAYVQEIGRAGRADSQAQAIMFYNGNDLAFKQMQANMKEYCKNNDKCKTEVVNEHFGFYKFDKPTICCNICKPDMSLEWEFSQLSISDPVGQQQ
ncbi:hypothetical protein DPMN_082622 [Dreissena polymorpha]|uniref:Uncharacterized protein n=1 Tax=Dreissena polymorpha TaxID=45954 RepID=A0A9D4BAB1_DREPO|nr:hypothetical protein DPMN_082622 [Dreissena polymorpha]